MPARGRRGRGPAADGHGARGRRARGHRAGRPSGRITIAGAGPGEPDLLTLRARERLAAADLVVLDPGTPTSLAAAAPPGAALVVAKRGASGAAVRRRIISAARRGSEVVRLVAGSPAASAHVATELNAIAAAGVRFEIVPGVATAHAAAAYAGIPLLAPGRTGSVAYAILGPGMTASDWRALASAATAVVSVPGGGARPAAVRRAARALVSAGRPGSEPAALLRCPGRPEQMTTRATLAGIAARGRAGAVDGAGAAVRRGAAASVATAALLIAGPAAAARRRLDWFARRPLAGRTIVVTRARAQAGGFSALLRDAGARVLEAPAIALAPPRSWTAVDRAIARIRDYRILIFTSVNGVERFLDRLRARRVDMRSLAGLDIVAIGPATAAALEQRGLVVSAVPEDFRAEGLVALLGGRDLRGAAVLLPRAAVARDLLVRALRRRGARVDVVPVYRAVGSSAGLAEVRGALRSGRLDLVTFASSSTALHFAARFAGADRRRLLRVPAAVIGPVTAATARRIGFRVALQPKDYTIPALAAAIVRRLGARAGAARRPRRALW